MAMVVQHNMQAMNSSRMLGITTNAQAKSTEKLSSGYKINRAADDAAGLSISEKMRKQMRGLDRASTNAQDGVSAVQTAEGALTEVHDMLQRMNELAVQAANGTNSQSDRESIQDEVNQLSTEIDRVSETTKFNETYLLKGDADPSKDKEVTLGGHDAGLDKLRSATDYTKNVNAQNNASVSSFTFKVDAAKLATGSKVNIAGKDYTIVESGTDSPKENKYKADAFKDGVLNTDNSKITGAKAEALIHDALEQANKIGNTETGESGSVKEAAPNDLTGKATGASYTVYKAKTKVQQALSFDLHVGADADMNNKIGVGIEAMNSKYLGIKDIDVVGKKDGENINDGGIAATYAIDAIADAVAKVSAQRSSLGAVQNRLEHTINNVDNVVENTTAAESRIRDTDMADEMVTYSKNNILAQAGQSMLAQANQSTQGVLSLLQG